MVIYSIVRHYPTPSCHSSYTTSDQAIKNLRRIAANENATVSSDGWECFGNDGAFFYEIQESYLCGVEKKEDHTEGCSCSKGVTCTQFIDKKFDFPVK